MDTRIVNRTEQVNNTFHQEDVCIENCGNEITIINPPIPPNGCPIPEI